jgi:DNA-directed RNA polymerase subunit RPC12/RpoP
MVIAPQPCVRCGNEISAERQEALPDTMLCVACSREVGGEFLIVVTPERISKDGSLKKNYGGYTTRKIRKPIKRKDEE